MDQLRDPVAGPGELVVDVAAAGVNRADVLQRQVLERLILMRLQLARAADSGIRVGDDEVDSAIGRVAEQNRMTVDQLRDQVTRGGGSWNDFRNSLHDELVVQRLRQAFAQTISVSDAEVDSAIAAQANSGQQYHLAHILVALPDGSDWSSVPMTRAPSYSELVVIREVLDPKGLRSREVPS